MRPCCLMTFACLLFTGCTTPAARDAAAEAHGYERGYRQAVKEQYWLIQNQQRRPAMAPTTRPFTP